LIVGIALFVLNNLLIRSFEGKPRWLKDGLLSRLTRRNQKECKKLYGRLVSLQKKYLEISSQRPQIIPQDAILESLRLEIENEHKEIEESKSQQTLPHDYYRGLVLQAFNLRTPDNLSEEQTRGLILAGSDDYFSCYFCVSFLSLKDCFSLSEHGGAKHLLGPMVHIDASNTFERAFHERPSQLHGTQWQG
jgi:hypothetical protein